MLTIWGRLNSHNVKKVVWLAEELSLPYQRHDVGGTFGMDDAYLARNPNLLIPTIEDGPLTLWESNAILRYLAARHPQAGLWPEDPAVRALADRWMDWQFSYADAQRPIFLNLVRRAPEARDATAVADAIGRCSAMLAILDAELARTPWLSGDSFGIGDIPMGVYAHTWFGVDIARPSFPNVERWYRALVERPGYAANVMIPLT